MVAEKNIEGGVWKHLLQFEAGEIGNAPEIGCDQPARAEETGHEFHARSALSAEDHERQMIRR